MNRLLLILSLLASALLWSGCSGDEPIISSDGDDEPGTYLRLCLNVPTPSRSTPTGGELGDGSLYGTQNENKIENLTVFFYNHVDGPNAPDDTPIRYAVYIDKNFVPNGPNGAIVEVIKLVHYLPERTDRIVVAANCGNLTFLNTLGKVRNHELTQQWRAGSRIGDYTAFTMASAYDYDGHLTFADEFGDLDGTEQRPFGATVSIERTAARIDLMTTGATKVDDGLLYKVKNDVDIVHLNNIIIVNSNQAPSWLFKRVTENSENFDNIKYLGDEEIDTDKRPLNYVLEPRTLLKAADTPESTLFTWYGYSAAHHVEANYPTLFKEENSLTERYKDIAADGHITLGYTHENTQLEEMHLSKFTTGLSLKATYVPKGFNLGEDFWRYTPAGVRNEAPLAKYFHTAAEAEDYKEKHADENGTVTPYPGGICYYHAWIRHANYTDPASGNHACTPMEYAIVRNNVYQLTFTFSGPGTPKPDFDDPESLLLHVYVRKWNVRKEPTILM